MSRAILDLPSRHCDERPAGVEIDTVILHSMYNIDPTRGPGSSAEACKLALDQFGVSAHYLIDRAGIIVRLVAEEYRAWHAGESRMPGDGRQRVNDFSIGIELIADVEPGFTPPQYDALVELSTDLLTRHSRIRYILGHAHIAPERKSDPWSFDWAALERELVARLPDRPIIFPASPAAFG